jgi:uroporphyrinogen-III decarboxylase
MGEIRELAGPGVILVGNIPPRDILAAGTTGQVETAVKKALNEIANHDRIVWSAGGGMPPDVKDDNIHVFLESIRTNS